MSLPHNQEGNPERLGSGTVRSLLHGEPHREFSPLSNSLLAYPNYVSEAEWQALNDIAKGEKAVEAGTELHTPRSKESDVHLLVKGWACRAATTESGKQPISTLYLPGDVINLDALIDQESGDFVQMITDGSIISFPRARLCALKMQMPGIANTFLWLSLVENARISEWLKCLGAKPALQRVAHLFCEIAIRLNAVKDEDVVQITLPLTQVQIADTIGITQIHTNRTVSALRERGLIETSYRTLLIRDFPELCHIAEFDPSYLQRHEIRTLDGDGSATTAIPSLGA